MTGRLRRMGDDEGVALVMALVFLFVVGIFITVALEKAQSTSMSGATLRERGDLQYALDGGIERAVSLLQQDLAAPTDPVLCPAPATTEQDLTGVRDGTGLVLNGQTVSFSCRGLAGRAARDSDAGRTNYAIVVTDPATDALTTQSGASHDLAVDGSVYLAGDVTDDGLKKPLEIRGADVVQSDDTCVQAELDAVTHLQVDADQYKTCTSQDLSQVLPTVVLPTAPDETQDLQSTYVDYPLPSGNGNAKPKPAECRVFFPGRYAGPPDLLSGTGTVNWFLGGLYELDFVASDALWTISNQEQVVVGKPVSGDQGVARPSSCPDTNKIAADGGTAFDPALAERGGTFVLGGTSRIVVKGSLLMASPAAWAGSDQPVNVVAARGSDTGFTPWTGPDLLLQNDTAQSAMVFNARVMAPHADVAGFASLPNVATFRGGVVARRLHLGASAAAQDIAVQASGLVPDPPDPYRTVRLTSRDASGTTATNVAVVNISNHAPYDVTTLSWRSE